MMVFRKDRFLDKFHLGIESKSPGVSTSTPSITLSARIRARGILDHSGQLLISNASQVWATWATYGTMTVLTPIEMPISVWD